MKNYYENIRADVIGMLPERKYCQVIEIGGGDFPTIMNIAQNHDATPWGVDIRKTQNKNIKFIQGSIEDLDIKNQLPDKFFDLMVANDVVEHLLDIEGFFSMAHDKIKPNGILALSVPNIRQLRAAYQIFFQGTFPRQQSGLFDKTHLRWYCKKDVLYFSSAQFRCLASKSSGRLVPKIIERTTISEFLGLHNLFVFEALAERTLSP